MIRGRVRGLPHLSSTAWTARFLGMGARLGNHDDIAPQPIVSLATGWCLGVEALSRFPAGAPDAVFAPARGAGAPPTPPSLRNCWRSLHIWPASPSPTPAGTTDSGPG